MTIKIIRLFSLILFVAINNSSAQQMHYFINQQMSNSVEKNLYSKDSNFHTSIRPYRYDEVNRLANIDSLNKVLLDSNRLYILPNSWWSKAIIWSENKLFDEDLISIDSNLFKMRANLLLNLNLGKDFENDLNTWNSTRGYWLEGSIGKKFYFNSALYENQAKLLPYQRAYSNQSFVIPGQGRFKLFKESAVDWGFTTGSIGYRPNSYFNFELGHGKSFYGDGYRSLLLSDNAANSPFFKIETTFWKMKYSILYQSNNYIGFTDNGDRLFDSKYSVYHYLSYNVTKRFNLSFFENVTWGVSETRAFDWNYLNPVVLMRSVEWQNGSSDRVLIGANSSYKLLNKTTIYGQFVLDDLNIAELRKMDGYWGNKFGYQLGFKSFDLFKIPGLSIQSEYNAVRPYVYSHFDPLTAHTQLNQSLAHPLGANFHESVNFVRFRHKRHFVQLRYSYAIFGLDQNGENYGGNIFLSYNENRPQIQDEESLYGHKIGQGLKTQLSIFDAKYSYLVNPMANLLFEMGVTGRNYKNDVIQSENLYFYIGVKTALHNFYYDFL